MQETTGRRLDPEKVSALCVEIFTRMGMSRDHANMVADNLVFADLRGISTHGVTRVKTYCERAKQGLYKVAPKLQLVQETASSFLMDGDDGFGAAVGTQAMKLAIQKAKETGVGIGFVRRSNHFGAASYYTLMAAKENMIGFCCTNSLPNMVPFGGMDKLLGTNPFSMAVPAATYSPMVLDVATSVAARGNILNAAKNGVPIPDGWAVDENGVPTTDAEKALRGAVLPFAGHKGSGIAIMIDVLCGVLSGAAFGRHLGFAAQEAEGTSSGANIGHFFLAMNVAAMQDLHAFLERMDQLIRELKQSRAAPGVEEILYPGELEQRRVQENSRLGILVSEGAYQELSALCSRMGLEEPLRACLLKQDLQ